MSFILELPWRRIVLSPSDLVKRLSLTKTSRVLEVGAGSGFYSVAVAQNIPDGKLELLDLQEEMLEKARLKMESAGLKNVGYSLANAGGQIPFETESFDVVFMVTVLGEVKDQKLLVRELHRLLRGNGILSVSEHLPDPDFVSFEKLSKLLEKYDFKLSRRFGRRWAYTANFQRFNIQ
ncbi:MAG: methyltransferase domain-containing protein [Acidobacteriota bacterium]|nr:methyltransferase domain-containing protein [Acidobacteriota bacterium]